MEDWLRSLYGMLPEGEGYYLLIGIVALFESIVGVGLLVPGSVAIVFAGFLAFHGKGNLPLLVLSAAIGACAGDLLSYIAGARVGATLMQWGPLRRHHRMLEKAALFFADHGGKSVFFGRFLGPLRGFIPFVAGGARMRPIVFIGYTIVASALWGIIYPGLGYLGGASWQQVRIITGRFGVFLSLLLLLFIVNGLFWKRAAPRLSLRFARLWISFLARWGRLLRTPPVAAFIRRHPHLWSFFAERFTLHSGTGLYLTTGFLFSTLFAALFVWLAIGLPAIRSFDWQIHAAFQEIRHPAADTLMVVAASLADGPAVLLLAGYVLLCLVLHNRDFSALVLAVGLGGGELLIFLLHRFFQRPAPGPLLSHLPEVFTRFPSGHAFATYLLYGLTTYFILGTFSAWKSRLTLIIGVSFLALLVGFSRVYLGQQWASSVLAGYALAALWLTFLITAAEMRRRYAGEFPWRTGWEPLRLPPRGRRLFLALLGAATATALSAYILRQVGF